MENNNEVNNLGKENLKNEQTKNKRMNDNTKSWIIISIIISIIIVITVRLAEGIAYKPIIYLYPEEEIQLSVKLGKENNITCSYPEYKNGWNVIAKPDGKLVDIETGRNLYALYWEGIYSEKCAFTEGFVVKGDETIKFLEEKLSILGLNEIEAEEFIVYWLPILQENEYNYIRFATLEEINNNMPLELSVEPDTLIRVLMQYKPLKKYMEVEEQELTTPERKGFTVVE